MPKEKRLEIRLNDEDFARLEAYAKGKDVSMAQILREYIKRLPKPVD
ncbi:MAG: ribbon-helix-helix protein, CopG family [Trichocoleus desertorum ATA4-8-CV12]|jgi:predicted DNA-binding protein|nr:ribbon-helix-helix protein, CopG family [Trichocoleus desertorum ATA4-8-CV12]